jgi:hypothetical protein
MGFPLQYYGAVAPGTLKVGGAYVNDFPKFTDLKTAKDRFIVTPNNVTIDGYSNFDVTNEPLVVFVPKLPEPRWYIVQIGDSFDEIIHNVGGIKGEQPGVYLITGPDFAGDIPGDMIQVKSRTRLGALGSGVFVNGTAFLRHRQNFFDNRNITAIVLEVPSHLIGKGTVHAWATLSLYGHAPEMQVSRWGLPMITHLFLNDPGNQEVKETFNKSVPSDDIALFSGYIYARSPCPMN